MPGTTPHTDPSTRPGDHRAAAWDRLQAGNRRWAGGDSSATAARSSHRRATLVGGQSPFAAVLSCSDSRVPVEILFDQGLGDLFVVRTAGHVADYSVIGSLEYAVKVLGVDLVVVMGHESCGAVAAAADSVENGTVPDGYVRDLVERISSDVNRARRSGVEDVAELGRWHTAATVDLLLQRSELLRERSFEGSVGFVGATYELATGLVRAVPAVTGRAAAPVPAQRPSRHVAEVAPV